MTRFSSVNIDPDTVNDLIQGLRAAQEAVYRAFERPVYSLCVRLLQDEALAADATQETFIAVLGGARKLKRGQALSGWIRTIAVNECYQRLRSPWHKRRQALPEEDVGAHVPCLGAAASDAERAFAQLDGDARMIVWLHEVEGYTHGEIGKLFEKTSSFSKSQLSRALEQLRTSLGQNEGRVAGPGTGALEGAQT